MSSEIVRRVDALAERVRGDAPDFPRSPLDYANFGAQWLADCHSRPEQVWHEWDDPPAVALLPAGRRWDAVSMSLWRFVMVAVEMGEEAITGVPVLADSHGRVYVFALLGTAEDWAEPGTQAHGRGAWLVASRPGGPPMLPGLWIQAPGPGVRLLPAETLREALRRTLPLDEDLEVRAYSLRRALEGLESLRSELKAKEGRE